MSEIISDVCIFYQNVAPEFVVMKRHMESGIAYYMNNGHIEVRGRVDNHIIEEAELTQESIEYLKKRFEEDERNFKESQRQSEQFRREVEEDEDERTW